ncbi:hypothetical protein PVL29_007944 [Vitis rotundifolia]|uniref:Uncharacterized protein n=1 Tax=Vitis rotundifolia TaxID=103349 RepID=A0AA39A3A5_VITRO|nr:hypothetical protein PVL29_007944 [Vitis rotundifolia]
MPNHLGVTTVTTRMYRMSRYVEDLVVNLGWGDDTEEVAKDYDASNGQISLNEIKDSVVAGFKCASKEDASAKENMGDILFEVCNVVFHAGEIHIGNGQINDCEISGL